MNTRPSLRSYAARLIAAVSLLAVVSALQACLNMDSKASASSVPAAAGQTASSQDSGAQSAAQASAQGAADAAARNQTSVQTPASASSASAQSSASSAADLSSHGGSITFENMGASGWYPSRRDPASGACDAYNSGTCCMSKHAVADSGLAPWSEELILTLRGPMLVKRMLVYQPHAGDAGPWDLVSDWQGAGAAKDMAFRSDAGGAFTGAIGNKCLVDVASAAAFPCGPGSLPYCPAGAPLPYFGWAGSKLMLIEASMPHYGDTALAAAKSCSTDKADNWYDAPWIGLSVGELIRAGAFSGCNCYGKNPAQSAAADGCGQFNAFEVVNDNNAYQNFDVFSTDFVSYAGYVGEGPCGKTCNETGLDPAVDLINKTTGKEAVAPITSDPKQGPGAAFRRPASGYRWFLILMDMQTRTVQMAMAHPADEPPALAAVVDQVPSSLPRTAIANLLAMRLPASSTTGIIIRGPK